MNTKQVSEWLMEARKLELELLEYSKESLTCYDDANGVDDYSKAQVKIKEKWQQRAAQVEAMTCDGCYHWDNSPWQVTPETRLCMFPEKRANAESWGFVNDCGPKFGCIHWEEKDK